MSPCIPLLHMEIAWVPKWLLYKCIQSNTDFYLMRFNVVTTLEIGSLAMSAKLPVTDRAIHRAVCCLIELTEHRYWKSQPAFEKSNETSDTLTNVISWKRAFQICCFSSDFYSSVTYFNLLNGKDSEVCLFVYNLQGQKDAVKQWKTSKKQESY